LKTKSLNSAGISIINFANSAWYACTQLANYSMNLNVQLEDHNDVIEMRHIQHSGRQMSSSDTPKQSKWLSTVHEKGWWYIQALFEETCHDKSYSN